MRVVRTQEVVENADTCCCCSYCLITCADVATYKEVVALVVPRNETMYMTVTAAF